MQSLPSDLYECASLDGANGFQKFRKLTVPLLANTTFFITITSIISSFQVFGYINVMTGGGPKDSTYVLVYYIYKLAFDYHKTGYGSAVAVVLFLILLIITIIQYVHIINKIKEAEKWQIRKLWEVILRKKDFSDFLW